MLAVRIAAIIFDRTPHDIVRYESILEIAVFAMLSINYYRLGWCLVVVSAASLYGYSFYPAYGPQIWMFSKLVIIIISIFMFKGELGPARLKPDSLE